MNELKTLLIQNLKQWQESQEQTLKSQNTHIENLEQELQKQLTTQETMQTQIHALENSLLDLEPLLQRLNIVLKNA